MMHKEEEIEKTELEKRLEAEAAVEASKQETPAPEAPPTVDVAALAAERDGLKDQLLRARAEFDNYRKRTAREVERFRKVAAEAVFRDLLPVVDNIERAVEHAADASGGLAEGVLLVLRQLHEVLARHGVEPIPAVGQPFDPNLHEAVTRMPSAEHPADLVSQEFRKGYRLGGYVLRPTQAVVSAGSPEAAAESEAGAPDRSDRSDGSDAPENRQTI